MLGRNAWKNKWILTASQALYDYFIFSIQETSNLTHLSRSLQTSQGKQCLQTLFCTQNTDDHQCYAKNEESTTDNAEACLLQSEGIGEGGETTIRLWHPPGKYRHPSFKWEHQQGGKRQTELPTLQKRTNAREVKMTGGEIVWLYLLGTPSSYITIKICSTLQCLLHFHLPREGFLICSHLLLPPKS